MNPSAVSAHEPFTPVALIADAAHNLPDVDRGAQAPGHWPSWLYPDVPDGLALCLGCWRPITAGQLGVEPCPGSGAEA